MGPGAARVHVKKGDGPLAPRVVVAALDTPFGREGSEGSKGSKGSKGSEGGGIALRAMNMKSALRDEIPTPPS